MKTASDFLAWILKPLVEIRPGERLKTGMMFLYFFLTITLIYILKPVRDSLFLHELGAKNLRYVYMGEGFFLVFVVAVYTQLAKRIPRKLFFPVTLGFFSLNLIAFWFLFHLKLPYLSAYFSVWVSCFSVVITTQFWMLANDLFNPGEAKRLFGLIISGGSAGGILGGVLTSQAVRVMPTEGLLLVASAVIVICIFLVFAVWKKIPQAAVLPANSSKRTAETGKHKPVFKLFFSSSHLVFLTLLVLLAKMSSTIIDNQFKGIVEMVITGKEAKTAFFGAFMAWMNGLSFIMQIIFTSLSLRFLGVSYSLWILPIGIAFFSMGTLAYPVLAAGILLKAFDGSMSYSIQQAGKEMLFLPIPSEIRYRVKPVIDMLGFRAAKSLAGVYIALLAPMLCLKDSSLGVLVMALIPVWIFLVWKIRGSYSNLLRTHVTMREAKKEDFHAKANEVLDFLQSEEAFRNIRVFMDHPSSVARKTAALALLFHGRYEKKFYASLGKLRQMMQEENFSSLKLPVFSDKLEKDEYEILNKAWPSAGELKDCPENVIIKLGELLRESEDLKIKMKAVRVLEFIPRQQSTDMLLHTLNGTRNHALRLAMVKALDRQHARQPKPVMNQVLIKSEIVREAKLHKQLLRILWFHGQHPKPDASPDYLNVAISALLDESVERIFHYLDLVYPQEAIHDIYFQLTASAEGQSGRHHALELLANTLEPDMRLILHNLFEPRSKKITEEETVEILKIFLTSEDRWFSWVSIFLGVEYGLADRWRDLAGMIEKYQSSQALVN